jgi:FkbH-like protein
VTLLDRKLAWRRATKTVSDYDLQVCVLSTFTANPLEPFLGMGLADYGSTASVHTGPYDQILSQCLMVDSELDQVFSSGSGEPVLVVWPRVEDVWRSQNGPLADPLSNYIEPFVELADAAISAAKRLSATLIFVLPASASIVPLGVGDAANSLGYGAAGDAVRLALREVLSRQAGVLVVDAEAAVRALGTTAAFNPRTLTTARIPYTDALFDIVGRHIGRLVSLSRRGSAKLAVLDADNTLWGGVVGEDGADGIDLLDNGPGEAFRAFQSWLLELRRAGLLLAVASKNNEPDLWEGFNRREMVLNQGHLAGWRVNWQPKPANLLELADELNLGVASFVFVDDNPVELEAMRALLPAVRTVQMPEDASMWVGEIAQSGLFDRLPPTQDDLGRATGYQVETQRRALREVMSPADYRASLEIEVVLELAQLTDLPRLAQLVAKTNQFTLGGPRHSETTLGAMINSPEWVVCVVSAKDRFGDYGVVGASISSVASANGIASLDTFVLSCRAMGRGVEDAMVVHALEQAGGALRVTVRETPKNLPGRAFFASIGASADVEVVLSGIAFPEHVARS